MQHVFFLLGGEFGAVKPCCLYSQAVWLVSNDGLGSDFCARYRINRAKKILNCGLQHVAMVMPIPKPQDPLRYSWLIPHKQTSEAGRPGRLAAITA